MSTVSPEQKAVPQNAGSQKQERSSTPFEGRIVSVTGNKLVMTNRQGKQYSHTLATDAKLTCDGTVCTAEDLKAGSQIRVTTKSDDRHVATCVESLDQQAEFAQCH